MEETTTTEPQEAPPPPTPVPPQLVLKNALQLIAGAGKPYNCDAKSLEGRKGCLLREVYRLLRIPPSDQGLRRFIWDGLLLQEGYTFTVEDPAEKGGQHDGGGSAESLPPEVPQPPSQTRIPILPAELKGYRTRPISDLDRVVVEASTHHKLRALGVTSTFEQPEPEAAYILLELIAGRGPRGINSTEVSSLVGRQVRDVHHHIAKLMYHSFIEKRKEEAVFFSQKKGKTELRSITMLRLRRFRRVNRYAKEGDGQVTFRKFKFTHGRIGLPALTSTSAYEQLKSVLLTYFRRPGSARPMATLRELAAMLLWDKRTATLLMASLRSQAELLVSRRHSSRESMGDLHIFHDGHDWCIGFDCDVKPEEGVEEEVEDDEMSVAEGAQRGNPYPGPAVEIDPMRLIYRMVLRSGSRGVSARDIVKHGHMYQKQAIKMVQEMAPSLQFGCRMIKSGEGRSSVTRFYGPWGQEDPAGEGASASMSVSSLPPTATGGGGGGISASVLESIAAPPLPAMPPPATAAKSKEAGTKTRKRTTKPTQMSNLMSVEKQIRIKTILDLLKEQRIFTTVTVGERVAEIESAASSRKMDKRSLMRIVEDLEKQGFIATNPSDDGTNKKIIRPPDMSLEDEEYKAFVDKLKEKVKSSFFGRGFKVSGSNDRLRQQLLDAQGGGRHEFTDAAQSKEYLRLFKVTSRPMVKVKVMHQYLWGMLFEGHPDLETGTFTMYDLVHNMTVAYFVRIVGLKADEWPIPMLEKLKQYVEDKTLLCTLPTDFLSLLLISNRRWSTWFRDAVYVLVTLGLVEGHATDVHQLPPSVANGGRVFSDTEGIVKVVNDMLEGIDQTHQLVLRRKVSIPLAASNESKSDAAQSVFGGNTVEFVLKAKEDLEAYWKTLRTFALNSVPLKASSEAAGPTTTEAEEGEGAYRDRARGIGGGLTQLSEGLRKKLRIICQEKSWVHVTPSRPRRQRASKPKPEGKRRRKKAAAPGEEKKKKRKKSAATPKPRAAKKAKKAKFDWIEQAMDISAGGDEDEEEDEEEEEEEEEESEETRRFDEVLIEEFVKQRCRPFQSKREVPLFLQTQEEAAMRQVLSSTNEVPSDGLVSQIGSRDVFQVPKGAKLGLVYGPMMEKSGRSRSRCFERLRYLLRHKEKAEQIRARLLAGRMKSSSAVPATTSLEELRLLRIQALSEETPVLAAIFVKVKQAILSAEIPSEQVAARGAFQIFDAEAIRRVYRMMWDEGWLEERYASKKAAAAAAAALEDHEEDEEGEHHDGDDDMSTSSQGKAASRTRKVKDGMKLSKRFWDCLYEASWAFPTFFYEQLTGEEAGLVEVQQDLQQGRELAPAAVAHLVEVVPTAEEFLWRMEVECDDVRQGQGQGQGQGGEEEELGRQQEPARNKQGVLAPVIRRIKTELTDIGKELLDQRFPFSRPAPVTRVSGRQEDEMVVKAISLMQTGGYEEVATAGGQDEMVPRDVNETLATSITDAEYNGVSMAELCELADAEVVFRWLRQVIKQGEVVRVPGFLKTRFVLRSNAECWLLPSQDASFPGGEATSAGRLALSWVHFHGQINTDLLVKALRAIVTQVYTSNPASLTRLHEELPHFTIPELVILLRGLVQAQVLRLEVIQHLAKETLTSTGRVNYVEGGVGPWDYDEVDGRDLLAYPTVDCVAHYGHLEYKLRGSGGSSSTRQKSRPRARKRSEGTEEPAG